MQSKLSLFFFQTILIFSFLFTLTENVVCQIGALSANSVNLKMFSGVDAKAINLTRPRIYKEKENPIETSAKKAVTNFSFEQKAFEEINQQRALIGLQPLIWSDDAAKIARLHSENMANFKFFSHEGLDGSMVDDRADSFGIRKWRAIGENIAYNRGYANPIEFAVDRWMHSTGHRENILSERWKESGIGIAITATGEYYFTEVFLQRK